VKAPEPGLRDQKKAQQKIAIMDALVAGLETRELGDIRVEDLCSALGISKVTFFNYFDSKEQVIEYYVHRWQFSLRGELANAGLSGRKAIELIFESVGTHPAGQRVMNAVMLFFLKTDHYTPMPISEYEYYLFDPDAYTRGIRPGDMTDLLSDALEAARVEAERRGELVRALAAGFYGVAITAKIRGDADLAEAYRKFVRVLL
jgi:AcrR family transcriptional regulator